MLQECPPGGQLPGCRRASSATGRAAHTAAGCGCRVRGGRTINKMGGRHACEGPSDRLRAACCKRRTPGPWVVVASSSHQCGVAKPDAEGAKQARIDLQLVPCRSQRSCTRMDVIAIPKWAGTLRPTQHATQHPAHNLGIYPSGRPIAAHGHHHHQTPCNAMQRTSASILTAPLLPLALAPLPDVDAVAASAVEGPSQVQPRGVESGSTGRVAPVVLGGGGAGG